MGIESAVQFCIASHTDGRQFEFFWHDEETAEHFRPTLIGWHAVDAHGMLTIVEQSADEIEKCRLSCAVFAQESYDVSVADFQGEVGKYGRTLETVSEVEMIDADHVVRSVFGDECFLGEGCLNSGFMDVRTMSVYRFLVL